MQKKQTQKLARKKLVSTYTNSLEAKRTNFLKSIHICLTIPPLDSKTPTTTDRVLNCCYHIYC